MCFKSIHQLKKCFYSCFAESDCYANSNILKSNKNEACTWRLYVNVLFWNALKYVFSEGEFYIIFFNSQCYFAGKILSANAKTFMQTYHQLKYLFISWLYIMFCLCLNYQVSIDIMLHLKFIENFTKNNNAVLKVFEIIV